MRFFLLVVFYAFSCCTFAQIVVRGKVTDARGSAISHVNIIAKYKQTGKIIKFASSDKGGLYEISYTADSVVLSFSFLGYQAQEFPIYESQVLDVVMEEESFSLKEVLIKGEQRIRMSGDTVEYNVKSFADGTEKKIEEVIKKLPGITVEEDGKIKYKGKNIDNILLDGTDMFANDYRLASRNIPAKFISKVQAIENYHENALLKDSQKSDKVVLNLTFDEDVVRSNIFGEASLSGGYRNKYDISANLFSVNKKLKVYNTLYFNNSERSVPFSSKENVVGLFSDYGNFPVADSYVVNNEFVPNISTNEISFSEVKREFNSFNIAYRPHSKIELSGNLLLNKNKNLFYTDRKTIYDNLFTLEEYTDAKELPQTILGSLKAAYRVNRNLKLDYRLTFDNDTREDASRLFVQDMSIETAKGKQRFFNNYMDLTMAMKDSSAITFNLALLSNSNSQGYTYSSEDVLNVHQLIKAENKKQSALVKYYKRKNENLYITTSVGYDYKEQQLNIGNGNEIGLKASTIFGKASVLYKFLRSNILVEVQPSYKKRQLLSDNTVLYDKARFELPASLRFQWEANSHRFSLSGTYVASGLDLNNYVTDSIYTGYRSIFVGTRQYTIGENISYSFSYSYFDIFKKLTFMFGANRLIRKGVFADNLLITPQMNYLSLAESSGKTIDLVFMDIKKYLDPLRLTVNVSSNAALMKYENAINSDYLKRNQSLSLYTRLSVKSALSIPFNYTVGGIYRYSHFKSEGTNGSVSVNYSLFQDIIVKSGNFKSKLSFDECFLGKNRKLYLFINPSVEYAFPKLNMSVGISAYNILDNRKIEDYLVDDYSAVETSLSIRPAQALLFFNFRF